MLMIMPDKVKVGWKVYDVIFADSRLNSGAELYGQVDHDTCTITLRNSSSPDQMRATLIHEVLHAVSDMYGIELEEKVVTDLANALYCVYKDNIETEKMKAADGETMVIDEVADDSQGQKTESRYANDSKGGIHWLFHHDPEQDAKKVKVRIVNEDYPQEIAGYDADEVVVFALHDNMRDNEEVAVYCSVDIDNVFDVISYVKEKVFHIQ